MRGRKWAVVVLLLGLGLVQEAFAGEKRFINYWLLADTTRMAAAVRGSQVRHSLLAVRRFAGSQVRYSPFAVRRFATIAGVSQEAQKRKPFPDGRQRISPTAAAPRFSLKNGTLSLLDPFAPSFNIAAEHILRPRLYGHLEAGPMFNLRLFDEPTLSNLNGYRLRAALRYYLRPPKIGGHAAFIEVMYTHRYAAADTEGDFRRNSSTGRYRQRIGYGVKQRRQGAFLNLGLQQVYARRFIFEFGAGLGVSHTRADYSDVPPDATFRTNGGLSWEYERFPNSPNLAAVQVYINLGYVLW